MERIDVENLLTGLPFTWNNLKFSSGMWSFNTTAPVWDVQRLLRQEGCADVRIVLYPRDDEHNIGVIAFIPPTDDTPPQPDLAQQLADALARAERAERERDALKAFVEGLADVAGDEWPRREPIRAEYGSWDAFDRDMRTWDLKVKARAALAAAEKAVGDESISS